MCGTSSHFKTCKVVSENMIRQKDKKLLDYEALQLVRYILAGHIHIAIRRSQYQHCLLEAAGQYTFHGLLHRLKSSNH